MFLFRIICWWRNYHLTPGKWGWLDLQQGYEVYCLTCGRRLTRQDKVRKGPHTVDNL